MSPVAIRRQTDPIERWRSALMRNPYRINITMWKEKSQKICKGLTAGPIKLNKLMSVKRRLLLSSFCTWMKTRWRIITKKVCYLNNVFYVLVQDIRSIERFRCEILWIELMYGALLFRKSKAFQLDYSLSAFDCLNNVVIWYENYYSRNFVLGTMKYDIMRKSCYRIIWESCYIVR